VKNNLQIISTLFRIPYQDIEDTNALRLIKSGESRVNAMALIHRQLSEKTSFRTITLDSFLGELAHYLDHSFGFTNGGGVLKITCPAITVDIDCAIPLSLVINELIGNSMKHSRATHINVQISKSGNGIGIEVSDNGVGSKSDQPQTPGGFGLRLISMMVKDLHGTMAISTSNGFHTHINIPSI
jgi:two-component sensor histidine kinase